MINNIQYTNIRVILDNLLQNELLQDLTLEQAVGYTIRFIGLFNMPKMYADKEVCINIHNYKGELPCDLVSVIQVRDNRDGICIPTISGTFFNPNSLERGFKTQGRVIYTTFKEGDITVAYRAIPVDEEGYPLIIDNEKFKNALELYIKQDRFGRLFEKGQINQNVFQYVQQEYAWAAGQLSMELKMPSMNEWENISQAHNQLLPKTEEFKRGFETTGITEPYKTH